MHLIYMNELKNQKYSFQLISMTPVVSELRKILPMDGDLLRAGGQGLLITTKKKEITCIMTIPMSSTLSRKKLHPWRTVNVY